MVAYAVLGATGNCGVALIDNLLRIEGTIVHAYCRNRNKLFHKAPQLSNNTRVRVYEGSIHDVDLLARCIRDTRAVFHAVSTNDNVPGCSIGLKTAETIISALKKLRADTRNGTKLPKIILLSSSTFDSHLSRHMPWFFKQILLISASNVYNDLRRTEAFLRSEQDWVTSIIIKPGGLAVDVQRGHELNFDHDESFVSYLDLAAAMIEAADDPTGRYDLKKVSVVNTNGGAKFPSGTPLCILAGLLRHFFPFLHNYLPSTGPS
ncbi:putative NAD-dependent epimerase/dehydratase [Viridothelium virens]|uniref:Putative NAD-dependent epimerase/dehydratase n=1 Tax=Viridothelium virens TaxID=1048519 RepID=A0A6A6H441_VIRVR|nr:putative NAD-dependent epimerase/dehydratase [Viridothelium virens]